MRRRGGVDWAKLLSITIIVWLVSAVYSYRVSYERKDPRLQLWRSSPQEASVVSLIWTNFSPADLKLKAKAAILIDGSTGEVIFAKNQDAQLPIASLTKLATAMVFLETNPDLNAPVTITAEDKNGAGRTRLYTGETITLLDCLHLCLMKSDNVAARALARSTGYSMEKFVYLMNTLAYRLGLKNTQFVDPTGLYAGNVSTAADYVRLARAAFENPLIAEITSRRNYHFTALNPRISHTIYNTNRLVYSDLNLRGGKTGYISQSGYCLALDALGPDGRKLTAVLLGAPSNGHRYRDAWRLLDYAMNR